ncbi:MAG TPA: hypothetical protein VGP41_08615 [Candidatus Lustribacter sp.]|jgi:hypothetical protein|nr:hypothetical protein [Candidatus Lustribacter sp.]
MLPFRTYPDPIDRIACDRCGHPLWDHCISLSYAEYQSGDETTACNRFALPDFTELTPATLDAHARAN